MISPVTIPTVNSANALAPPRSPSAAWLRFAAMIFIYKLLLDASYEYVAYAYDYQTLFYNGRTFYTQIISWLALLFSLPALKRVFDDRSASGNLLSLLALFSFIPMMSVVSFRSDYDFSYVTLMGVFWAIFFFSWNVMKPIHFRTLTCIQSEFSAPVVAIILAASVLIYSYINIGFRLHFDLIAVYDIRAEARDFIAPFPLNYLVSLADNLLAVLAVFFFMRGHRIMAATLLFVIFVNFSITGTKQILFVPALGFVGYFIFKKYINSHRLLTAAVALAGLCIFETWVSYSATLHGLFTYRVIFIPAELHYIYYDYFQSHDILLYSQSILKPFFDVEQENIQFVLGEYAIGDYTARANNGLFSDAYMNLGVIGVLIYPVLLAVFLRTLDGAIVGLPKRFTFVIVLYAAFVLLGMTLTSALITSGLLFLIFLLYSLPRNRPATGVA